MDQATCDLLTKWNLAHYVDKFAAEGIDIATMLLLEKPEIITMFPKIGDRVRFQASLALYKDDQREGNLYNSSLNSINTTILEAVFTDCITASNSEGEQIGEKSSVEKRPQDLEEHMVHLIPDLPELQEETIVLEEVEEIPSTNKVYDILQASAEGRQIYTIGKQAGSLPSTVRGRLCKFLMQHMITAENPVILSDSQLLTLSHDIGRLFPKESPPLYYAPYLPADAFQAKRNTSGWLVNARRARRTYLIALGLLEKPKSRSLSNCSTNSGCSNTAIGIDIEGLKEGDAAEVASALELLKSHSPGPWQEICALWSETVRARLWHLYYEEGTLNDYFKKYPILQSPNGWQLLVQDFGELFPDKPNGINAIEATMSMIFQSAQNKLINTRDKFLRKKITELLSLADDEKPQKKITAAILLIGCLFNIPSARRSKKDWQASRAEVLDGFVTIVDTEADVEVTIEERRQKLLRIGITLQPIIIWIRESGVAFIVCDNTFYKLKSLPEAVDVTFKIFHATAAKYPTESYNIWLIIQLAFYKINTSYDRLSQSLKETLVTLGVAI